MGPGPANSLKWRASFSRAVRVQLPAANLITGVPQVNIELEWESLVPSEDLLRTV